MGKVLVLGARDSTSPAGEPYLQAQINISEMLLGAGTQ